MANILSLAMKINADASGVVKNLTPAERALEKLGGEAAKVTKVFDEFAGTSEAAATAQAQASKSLSDLSESLARGEISAKDFATEYAKLTESINKEAAAFKRAAAITEANLSPTRKYEQAVAELDEQVRAGRISQETYQRAMEKAGRELEGTAKSATKADKSLESLTRNTKILAGIEIGRLVLDGVQAIGSVFQDIGNRISSLVSNVNSSIDTLNDFSARTGIGVESLQGYSLAAKLAGVDTEQFQAAVQKLAVNIGKAAPGDALDKSLRGINLSVAELRALAPEEQFSAIGSAISQLPTAADRAAAAVEIFGKQGAALAPLFREGAASIEELQARAERLGIIVSETQVGNVADMNDAFDLVLATVQGITGQVLGNLAPAVTAVVDEFLTFVESWSGAQGTGGAGIANAITDTLLDGALIFAGIFDQFVGSFTQVSAQLENVSGVFKFVANLLEALSGTFKAIFNTFEIIGNGVAIALGKVLEAIGRYVSSDLKAFGQDLQNAATQQLKNNIGELEAAGQQITQATTDAIFGDPQQQQAAATGAATQFLEGIKSKIARERSPQFQIETNIETTRERFDSFFQGIVDNEIDISESMRAFEAAIASVEDPLNMTSEEIERIKAAQEKVNQLVENEQKARQEAADAAIAQADADKKRLDQLLQTSDESTKLEQDLQAVQREQARVSEQLAAARASDNQVQADAAAARQGELDQLQAKLEDQQQALEQGFGQGFDAAFANVNQNIDGLIAKSQQFGKAGSDAALRLQEGIAAAQQQAKDGILNQEAFNQEVQRQQDLFQQELANIEEAEKAKDKAAEDRLTKEKQRQEAELKAQDEYRKQQEAALQAYQQQQAEAQKAYAEEQKRIFEEQQKAAAAEAKRQDERLRKLNTLGQETISVTDVRNAESANLVLQLGAAAQDPALIQQRLQTKLLEKIAVGIGQAASNYFNQPVAIVGYADVGGI